MTDVSVILPTRNRPEIFQRAFKCVLEQTHPAAEIIISDSSTNDETEQIVKANSHANVRYFRKDPELKMLDNWYATLEEIQNDWVKFCFDDDWIEPDFLKRTLEVATPGIHVVIVGGIVHLDEGSAEHCVGNNRPPDIAHRLCASGRLTVSPNGALSSRKAVEYANSVMHRLHPDCTKFGIGIDVVTNYAITTKYSDSWIQIPDILAHYDGRYGSFTIKTLRSDADLLFRCYALANEMMEELWQENQNNS